MVVKMFTFPTFEEWNRKREFRQKIGAYTCEIRTFAWGCNGNTKDVIEGAIAAADNPLNIYVDRLTSSRIECEHDDVETLKKWYEETIVKLNEHWEKYITKNYLE